MNMGGQAVAPFGLHTWMGACASVNNRAKINMTEMKMWRIQSRVENLGMKKKIVVHVLDDMNAKVRSVKIKVWLECRVLIE